MKTLYFLLFTFVFLSGCQMAKKAASEKEALYEGQKWNTKRAITTIAFGSCDRQDLPQDIWKAVAQNQPDLWIWTGDNIYGDSDDMKVLHDKYMKQKSGKDYSAFRKKTQITGIWDDHDFGVNDGGKEYPYKRESKKLMLDFLDVPRDAPIPPKTALPMYGNGEPAFKFLGVARYVAAVPNKP